jgi:hypothetical protein
MYSSSLGFGKQHRCKLAVACYIGINARDTDFGEAAGNTPDREVMSKTRGIRIHRFDAGRIETIGSRDSVLVVRW